MAILISSKVNQWILLVATLPAAFSISAGSLDGMPLASLYMLLTLVMLFTKREYIKGVPKMISNAFAGRGSGPGGG
ncbi:MAG: hypothetical protein IH955_07485 [Chloroflexi bacterium]|nr:hypothetical protein [Chloroflexota bacterium]